MMIVFCENTTCRHNNGEACMLSVINIETVPTNEFYQGNRIIYPVCQNYEEKENALPS